MKVRVIAAALAAVLLGAAPHRPVLTQFSAPAGIRPAGANPIHPVDAVLPDGRTAAPTGDAVFVGTRPLGVALSPDGRFAIVANASQDVPVSAPAAGVVGGYSLAVVDTKSMHVVNVYHSDVTTFFGGIAAVKDPAAPGRTIVLAVDGANNALRFFDLNDDGTLALEVQSVPMPGAADQRFAADNRAFPVALDVSNDGQYAYVANNLGGTVAAVDLKSRRLMHSATVGFYPTGVIADATHVYVTNGGLAQYHPLAQPARAPQFTAPAADPYKSSSLSVVPLAGNDDIAVSAGNDAIVRLDPVPDGIATIGGARPGAIALSPNDKFAYVALSNVDRVSIISLGESPKVEDGLDLRLFPSAPYGTQPSAIAIPKDGKRVYVALAGLNAVAVLDARNPVKLHRLGLIPTGEYPTALALSPDGRYLFVTSAKGVDGWGMLQRVDLKTLPLMKTTLAALSYNRKSQTARQSTIVPALRSGKRSAAIDRVVYISVGTPTFDELFGDLNSDATTIVNSDASLETLGGSTTPNLHALATTYALADNFYADDTNVDANRTFALAGGATLYTERMLSVNRGRTPLDAHGQDPENYPREGYIFNTLSRAGLSYRDYGGLMWLSGYTSIPANPRVRGSQPSVGYSLDVPSLAALDGHVDTNYPGPSASATSLQRAQEVINDMDRYVKADAQPAYTYIWLPAGNGRDSMAEADRAVGAIVDYFSHTPHWQTTAIFIAGDGVAGGRDHVNGARSYALVVSPLAKRHYVGKNHLSVPSVLKTEEELLGLPPLALNDLLATDMADFFSDEPIVAPYSAQQ